MYFNPQRFEDFIQDESFVRWVRTPDDESSTFWQQWRTDHPEFEKEISLARQMILSIGYTTRYELTIQELDGMFAQIKACQSDTIAKQEY